jgi:hypothetical protein
MAPDMQQATSTATTPPPDASAAQSSASAASAASASSLPALPSLNPEDSPYKPLSLPEVTPPNQVSKGMGEEQPIQNLGAVSKAGAAAYLASNVLRSAVQGYDAGRLQHAQRVNSQLQALGALDKQLTDQFTSAYNDVASSKTGPDGKLLTRQQILLDPSLASDPQIAAVRKLYHQGDAIHTATLNTIKGYIPSLADADETGSPGKGKKQKKNVLERMFGQDPNEALQAYYQVSKQTGWRGGYAGYSDQQAQAAYQQRQGKAAEQQETTTTAQFGANKAQLETELLDAEQKGDTARVEKAKKALADLEEAISPIRQPSAAQLAHESYLTALNAGQIPKDENGVSRSEEWWIANQRKAGTAAASPLGGSEWSAGLQAYAKDNKLDPTAWSTIRAYDADRYSAKNPLADRRLALAQRNSDISAANLALRQSSNDFNDMTKIFKQIGPDIAIQGTAQASDEYTKHPTGPGDVALTLAFFEVAKAADPGSGSGIRFTQQEQKLITGARGWADAAQANVQRWGKGTLYDDSQRQIMAQLIKAAAKRSNETTANYLGAAGKINPRATAAATGGAGGVDVTDPQGGIHHFPNQAAADQFKKAAGIQ